MEKRRLRAVVGAEIAAKFPAGLEKPRRRQAAPAGRDNHRRRQRPAGGVVGAETVVKRFGDLADGARDNRRRVWKDVRRRHVKRQLSSSQWTSTDSGQPQRRPNMS